MAVKTENGYILIVEDDRGTSELEARQMGPLGKEIRRAYTGAEAFEALKADQPELMLLDYSLPDGNAIEFLERLRAGAVQVPPFIVVTGRGDESVAVQIMKSGALDYLIKSAVFLENLLPTVQKAMEKSSLQAALKKSESDLRSSLRLYNFLAHVNQHSARQKDKKKLLSEICDIAITFGGLKMAWAGVPDRDTGRIIPLYSVGLADGCLDNVQGEQNENHDPKNTAAISTRNISLSKDVPADPETKRWREKALLWGYLSSASIPLSEGGTVTAVLNLYANEPNFFDTEELNLLGEIQGDISLALESISYAEKQASTFAALERTTRELTHIMEVIPLVLFRLRNVNGNLRREWVSGNVRKLLNCDEAEVLAPGWLESTLHPDDKERALSDREAAIGKGSGTANFRVRKKDNGYIWIQSQFKVLSDDEFIVSWTDISPLKESEWSFHELFENAPTGYFSHDADGNILSINPAGCVLLGRDKTEVVSRNISDFLTPDSADRFRKGFPAFKARIGSGYAEFDITGKDGSAKHLYANVWITTNRDASFSQLHCVFNDSIEPGTRSPERP